MHGSFEQLFNSFCWVLVKCPLDRTPLVMAGEPQLTPVCDSEYLSWACYRNGMTLRTDIH